MVKMHCTLCDLMKGHMFPLLFALRTTKHSRRYSAPSAVTKFMTVWKKKFPLSEWKLCAVLMSKQITALLNRCAVRLWRPKSENLLNNEKTAFICRESSHLDATKKKVDNARGEALLVGWKSKFMLV